MTLDCRACGAPIRIFAPDADMPDALSGDCWTPGCDLHAVTLPLEQLAALSDADMRSYGRARRRFEERRAEFAEREAVMQIAEPIG